MAISRSISARLSTRVKCASVASGAMPAAAVHASATAAGIAPEATLAHLTRVERRALIERLIATPLQVRDSRGYSYAEVTAGGVPLEEVDHRTMGSRACDGLYLVGEILDVDGRLGGFNFQWAWSSGWVAGHAIARRLRPSGESS